MFRAENITGFLNNNKNKQTKNKHDRVMTGFLFLYFQRGSLNQISLDSQDLDLNGHGNILWKSLK